MINIKEGTCSNCGKTGPLASAHYKLCPKCNQERLTANKPVKEKKKPATTYKPIKQVTSKEAAFKKELNKVKAEIEEDAIHAGKYFCEGCGRGDGGLDKSHIISLRRRKDLGLIKRNIRLLCRSCHEKWESRDLSKMAELICFNDDLQYIKENDNEWYHLLIN